MAGIEFQHPAAAFREPTVMRHQHQCAARRAIQIEQEIGDALPRGGVQVARGFVREQDLRMRHESTRYGDALLLASRKLLRIVRHPRRQSHLRERGRGRLTRIAAAAEALPPTPTVTLKSEGVVLVYGRDAQAVEAGNLLKAHLDVTVLITPPAALVPPRINEFPIAQGRIRSAKGHLGAFEITVDDFAQPSPSSRGSLAFGPARQGAVSRCDILMDLSHGAALFPGADLRDGYLRADPGDPAAVLSVVLKARDLVGTFDKPRYISFSEHLCAHSRSQIIGCTRCLDLCPAGAIAPAGDHVALDPNICAGCGQCAAACPTGAAVYALPPPDAFCQVGNIFGPFEVST